MYFTVTFGMMPDDGISFGIFLECVYDIYGFVRDVENWGDDLIPPVTGCPALESNSDALVDRGSRWSCLDRP